jgi:hypothetical protein
VAAAREDSCEELDEAPTGASLDAECGGASAAVAAAREDSCEECDEAPTGASFGTECGGASAAAASVGEDSCEELDEAPTGASFGTECGGASAAVAAAREDSCEERDEAPTGASFGTECGGASAAVAAAHEDSCEERDKARAGASLDAECGGASAAVTSFGGGSGGEECGWPDDGAYDDVSSPGGPDRAARDEESARASFGGEGTEAAVRDASFRDSSGDGREGDGTADLSEVELQRETPSVVTLADICDDDEDATTKEDALRGEDMDSDVGGLPPKRRRRLKRPVVDSSSDEDSDRDEDTAMKAVLSIGPADLDFVAIRARSVEFLKRGKIKAHFRVPRECNFDPKALRKFYDVPSANTVVVYRPVFDLVATELHFFVVFVLEKANALLMAERGKILLDHVVRGGIDHARALSDPEKVGWKGSSTLNDWHSAQLETTDALIYLGHLWNHMSDDCTPLLVGEDTAEEDGEIPERWVRDVFLFGTGHGQKCPIAGDESGSIVRHLTDDIVWEHLDHPIFGVGVLVSATSDQPVSVFATRGAQRCGLIGRSSDAYPVAGRASILNYHRAHSPRLEDVAKSKLWGWAMPKFTVLYSCGIHVSRSPLVETHHFDYHHFLALGMSPDIVGLRKRGQNIKKLGKGVLSERGRDALKELDELFAGRKRPAEELECLSGRNVALRCEVAFAVAETKQLFGLECGALDALGYIVQQALQPMLAEATITLPSREVWGTAARLVSQCADAIVSTVSRSLEAPLSPREEIALACVEMIACFVFSGRWMGGSRLLKETGIERQLKEADMIELDSEIFATVEGVLQYTRDNWEKAWKIVEDIYIDYAPKLLGPKFCGQKAMTLHLGIPRLRKKLHDIYSEAPTRLDATDKSTEILQDIVETYLAADIEERLRSRSGFRDALIRAEESTPGWRNVVVTILSSADIKTALAVSEGSGQREIKLRTTNMSACHIGAKLNEKYLSGEFFPPTSLFSRAMKSVALWADAARRSRGWGPLSSLGPLLAEAIRRSGLRWMPNPCQNSFMHDVSLFCRVTSESDPAGGTESRLARAESSLVKTNGKMRGRKTVDSSTASATGEGTEDERDRWLRFLEVDIRQITGTWDGDTRLWLPGSPMRAVSILLQHLRLDDDISGEALRALYLEAWRIFVPHNDRTTKHLGKYGLGPASPRQLQQVRAYYTKQLQIPYLWIMNFWKSVRLPDGKGGCAAIFQNLLHASQPALQPAESWFWGTTPASRASSMTVPEESERVRLTQAAPSIATAEIIPTSGVPWRV